MGKQVAHPTVSDSVGLPQTAGASESLYVRLENQGSIARPNISCGSRVGKRKNVLERPQKTEWRDLFKIDSSTPLGMTVGFEIDAHSATLRVNYQTSQ